MRRLAIPVGAAIAIVVVIAVGAQWLRPKDQSSAPGSVPGSAPTPSAAVAGEETVADSETLFINATAAQLCAAQSQVYDTPEALAAAYAESPDYAGLTPEQVDAYKNRLTDDPAFNNRVATTLAETCNPGGVPPTTAP